MPPRVWNVYNLRPRRENDYMKSKINQLISFAQVGNVLNEDAFYFLEHKVMENYEETIDYTKVIAYAFVQYSLNRGLKEFGKRGDRVVTEELSHLYTRYTFCPKSDGHLNKEYYRNSLESLMFLKFNRDGRVKG